MKKIIKQIARKFGIEISRYNPIIYEKKVVSLKSKNGNKGNVLLSFIIKPFLSKNYNEPSNASHIWECFQIAQTFLDLGYSVDVINYQNKNFIPKKNYSIFIDIYTNLERIAPLLNKGCIKILYPILAHWLFNNYASYKRSLELQKRKGVVIGGLRLLSSNQSIEDADCVISKANEFTINTFRYANKPFYRVPQITAVLLPWPQEKDFEACRKNFLWLSGGGLVHKGLDLALDAFSEMPDYHLYVCGAIQKEKDFEKAYYRELYETSNIHTIGWVDINSSKFIEIANNCIGHIHLSCSECGGASVLICMHAGLIPIVSYESSVDVHDFGVILNDCSIETIKRSIQEIANLPAEKLRWMSRKAWEFARENHTGEKFAEEYKKVITHIIEVHRDKKGIS